MKTLAALTLAALLASATAFADEKHEHASGPGLFGHPPEHVHVILNPIPVHGMIIGAIALAAALLARSRAARVMSLAIIVFAAASAWPVQYFGENAYQSVRRISDEQGQLWLDEHMERAENFLLLFYGTAVLGVIAIVSGRKFPKAAMPLTLATLAAAVACAGVGGWISRAGGHVRHPEFRHGPAPSTEATPHEHGATGQPDEHTQHDHMKHEQAQPSQGEHKHGAEQPGQRLPLPDSPEETWETIHQHHDELESAVNAKNFSDVQSHARHLSELAKRLIELSPADRKSAVETGANRVVQSLAALQQSAETGSELVMKNNFDEFAKALNELEQQAKQQ